DEGDNYTLCDVRDGDAIWWQDHETREVVLKSGKPGKRVITTPALCARYQWLVWLLARPLEKDGAPIQTVDDLGAAGFGRFRYVWSRREAHDAAFEAELRELAKDPHLAIYWLLHTTMFDDVERRARVVGAVGERSGELLRAFVTRLGALPLDGDLP